MSQKMGIYRITNNVNSKCYIGSATNVSRRMSRHLTDLRLGQHFNKHLQYSFNRYGEDSFQFDVVESVSDIAILRDREQFWIDLVKFDSLYNINPKTTKPPDTTGRTLSPEHKRSILLANTGRSPSVETRTKISLAQKGKIISIEQRKKMSLARKGKRSSPESNAKRSQTQKGRVFSTETRRKISEGNKGKVRSSEYRAKQSEAKKGKVHSVETRLKMSIAAKGKTRSPEHQAKIALAQKGKLISDETRAKLSLAHKGKKRKPLPSDTKEKIGLANGKAVRQIDPVTNETIATFLSASRAAREIGLKHGASVTTACRNSTKAGGYYWAYIRD